DRCCLFFFFFSSRRRHTRFSRDWSSDVCSSDLRMLIVGVSLFTLASLLCGLAQWQWMLVAARALQGAGAAVAAPAAFALVATTFAPGKARNQAIAVVGSMVGVGSVGGLVVGGALTQLSWRWIFLINVPIGALIIVGAIYCLADTDHHRMSLDIRGAV